MPRFAEALVRPPGPTFAGGLTSGALGPPDHRKALDQHRAYADALVRCGVRVIALPANAAYPDATFLEDVAILTGNGAVLTRPGAPSRRGEVALLSGLLAERFRDLLEIVEPGTLDGGDVCEAEGHFYIGISRRTNPAGAEQLARWLSSRGSTSSFVDILGYPDILHLKSGMAHVGDDTIVAVGPLAEHPAFRRRRIVLVEPVEAYAANCVQINDTVLVAAGFPLLRTSLDALGFSTAAVEMSEFQKMDGGLSCLSLRF
jgi:dimethylargininase